MKKPKQDSLNRRDHLRISFQAPIGFADASRKIARIENLTCTSLFHFCRQAFYVEASIKKQPQKSFCEIREICGYVFVFENRDTSYL